MADMTCRLGPLVLPNPVLTAAGCGGTGRELHRFVDVGSLGAIVTGPVLASRRTARSSRRTATAPGGTLTSVGWPGPGVDAFVAEDLPWLAERGARVIVSVAGAHTDDFVAVVRALAGQPAVVGVEVDISTPNPENRGQVLACDAVASSRVVGAVRRAADPSQAVYAKLSADVTDIGHIARACADAGVDGFTLINTVAGLLIDTDTLLPVLADGIGGLSGPAITPIALRCVWQVRRAVPHLPIIGSGGVRTGLDALQFLLAGASAVAVGSALFADPLAAGRVLGELGQALDERDFAALSDAVGFAHRRARTDRRTA